MADLISRQAAIDALWKALYEYEDKTEKQFAESDDLDVEDWIQHRIFVQNMSDIDRQTILELPSAQPERKDVFNRDIAIEAICDEVMLWFDISATQAYEIADTAVKRIEVRMEKMERGEQE